MATSDAAVDVNNLVDGWLLLEGCRDAGDVRPDMLRHSVSGQATRWTESLPLMLHLLQRQTDTCWPLQELVHQDHGIYYRCGGM